MYIDIHGHTYSFADPRQKALTSFLSPEQLLEYWPPLEIDRAVLLPLVHHECMTVLQTNEDILNICARFPGRFIPFCNLDPRYHYNSPQTDFTPALEHYKSLGCRGVGEMCANLPWDDPRVLNLLGHIERAGLPMLFHLGVDGGTYGLVDEFGLPRLEAALRQFPSLQLIGHSMAFWSAISGDVTPDTWQGYPTGPVTPGGRLVELLERYDNLWCDLSAGSGCTALTRDPDFGGWFMERFQDRLLFGSDLCWPDQQVPQPAALRKALAEGRLSEQAFEKIARGNAVRLLRLN